MIKPPFYCIVIEGYDMIAHRYAMACTASGRIDLHNEHVASLTG